MRIRFPYVISGKVALGRGNKPRDELFIESFEVDVPEFGRSDITLAMSVRKTHDGHTEYRFREGGFLARMPGSYRFHVGDFRPGTSSAQAIRAVHAITNSFSVRTQATNKLVRRWFEEPDLEEGHKAQASRVARWFSSDRDVAETRAREFAAKIVLMDGEVWFPSKNPR